MEAAQVCRRKTSDRRSLAPTGEQSENVRTKLPDAGDTADQRNEGKKERQADRFRSNVVRDSLGDSLGHARPRLFSVGRRGSRFTHTHTQLDAIGRELATAGRPMSQQAFTLPVSITLDRNV
jgi:hypothetical protein